MLYRENAPNQFVPWVGQAIENIVYPREIESLWTPEELATVGLYAPEVPGIPEHMQIVSQTVERIKGVVQFVFLLEPMPHPTKADVDDERERRIALPLSVTVSIGTFQINMDANAQRNIQGLSSVGQYFVAIGDTQLTQFRDFANEIQYLPPADLIAMGLQVAARIQAVYAKSWLIREMDPIPYDFDQDSYWE